MDGFLKAHGVFLDPTLEDVHKDADVRVLHDSMDYRRHQDAPAASDEED